MRRVRSRRAGAGEAPHAARRLAPGALDVVAASTGVRVEQEERPVLLREAQQRRDQRDVLGHVGEIAGVERVSVFHASPSQSRGRSQSCASDSSAEPAGGA
jgi:hypothetical protein